MCKLQRQKPILLTFHHHVCKRIDSNDLMATAGEIQQIAKVVKPAKIVIDTTGLGAGLYDRLRELLGDLVEGVNFASKAYDHQHYSNRRAEMWDLMRQWLNDPAGVQVPDSDELQGDLCAIVRGPGATRFNSSNQLVLEPKDHVKERLGFSPDLGDGSALTFAVDLSMTKAEDWSFGNSPMQAESGWLSA